MVRERVAWIGLDCLVEILERLCRIGWTVPLHQEMAFQVGRVRFRVARPVFRRWRLQSRLQHLGNACCDMVLYCEYILPISVEALRPDFETVLSIQEMNVDSDTVGHAVNGAFQDGV